MLKRIKREFEQGRGLLGFGFLSAVGQTLGMIVSLVVAKFFSPALFGSYSLARMIVFFFSAVLVGSSQSPFVVFANQEKTASGKINKSFSVQFVFLIASLILFTIIITPLRNYLVKFAEINSGDLVFAGLAFAGLALKAFLCNLFLATGERIKNAAAELVFGVLSLALVFVFYFAGCLNLRMVFLIYLLSAAGLIVIFSGAIDYRILLPIALEKKHFAEMFDFAKWVLLGSSAVYFIDWGDNIVLRIFVDMEDIGEYNFAYQIFKGVTVLTVIINVYFMPFISQNIENSVKMREYLYTKRPKIFLLGFVFIAGLFLIAPYAVRLIYGDVYRQSVMILRVLLAGSVLILFTIFYDPLFHSLKRYKFMQTVNVVQVLLNLSLDFILVPVMGIMGAALATVLGFCFRAILFEVYFRKNLKKALRL